MSEDYYKVLGVNRDASKTDIEKAYRGLARKYHPDMNPDDASAKKKFQEVQKAFESRRLVGGTGTAGSNPDAPVRTLTDVVALFDATNHTVRGQVREYAKSNDDITDGFDPPERYYLMVYDHWLDFAASELVSTLVDRERLRVNTAQAAASSTD